MKPTVFQPVAELSDPTNETRARITLRRLAAPGVPA